MRKKVSDAKKHMTRFVIAGSVVLVGGICALISWVPLYEPYETQSSFSTNEFVPHAPGIRTQRGALTETEFTMDLSPLRPRKYIIDFDGRLQSLRINGIPVDTDELCQESGKLRCDLGSMLKSGTNTVLSRIEGANEESAPYLIPDPGDPTLIGILLVIGAATSVLVGSFFGLTLNPSKTEPYDIALVPAALLWLCFSFLSEEFPATNETADGVIENALIAIVVDARMPHFVSVVVLSSLSYVLWLLAALLWLSVCHVYSSKKISSTDALQRLLVVAVYIGGTLWQPRLSVAAFGVLCPALLLASHRWKTVNCFRFMMRSKSHHA